MQALRYKALRNGDSAIRIEVMKEMRELGIKVNIKDFNFQELELFNNKVDLKELLAKE